MFTGHLSTLFIVITIAMGLTAIFSAVHEIKTFGCFPWYALYVVVAGGLCFYFFYLIFGI